jgi:hypothetical protein
MPEDSDARRAAAMRGAAARGAARRARRHRAHRARQARRAAPARLPALTRRVALARKALTEFRSVVIRSCIAPTRRALLDGGPADLVSLVHQAMQGAVANTPLPLQWIAPPWARRPINQRPSGGALSMLAFMRRVPYPVAPAPLGRINGRLAVMSAAWPPASPGPAAADAADAPAGRRTLDEYTAADLRVWAANNPVTSFLLDAHHRAPSVSNAVRRLIAWLSNAPPTNEVTTESIFHRASARPWPDGGGDGERGAAGNEPRGAAFGAVAAAAFEAGADYAAVDSDTDSEPPAA